MDGSRNIAGRQPMNKHPAMFPKEPGRWRKRYRNVCPRCALPTALSRRDAEHPRYAVRAFLAFGFLGIRFHGLWRNRFGGLRFAAAVHRTSSGRAATATGRLRGRSQLGFAHGFGSHRSLRDRKAERSGDVASERERDDDNSSQLGSKHGYSSARKHGQSRGKS